MAETFLPTAVSPECACRIGGVCQGAGCAYFGERIPEGVRDAADKPATGIFTEKTVWTIEISFYEGEVDPHSLYEAVETFVMKACPGFSGVVGMMKEVTP